MQIFIHRAGQQFGPYSTEEVRGYLGSGSLQANDLAWHEGAVDWVPLAQLEKAAGVSMIPAVEPLHPPQPSWVPTRRKTVSTLPAGFPEQTAQNVPVRYVPASNVPTTDAPVVIAASHTPVPSVTVAPFKNSPYVNVNPGAIPRKVQPKVKKISTGVDGFTRRGREMGAHNMGWGAFICGVGLAITYFSYEMAASTPGGGPYFLAWGAIVFGGFRFLRGVIQYCKA